MSSEKIQLLRKRFEEELTNNSLLYHPNDVERVRKEDWQVKRFLDEYENEDQAFNELLKSLKWKKEFGIHERDDQYFPKEFWELNGVEIIGQDNQKRYIQCESYRNQKTFKELKEVVLHFIAHQLERVDKMAGENGFTLLMDCNGAGVSNVDIELIKFKLSIINYYPGSLKQMLVADLPWLLNPVMSMIVGLLNAKLKEMVVYAKGKELSKYMNPDILPKALGGKRDKPIVPDNLKPLSSMMNKFGLTDKFIDSFYSQYKIPRPAA